MHTLIGFCVVCLLAIPACDCSAAPRTGSPSSLRGDCLARSVAESVTRRIAGWAASKTPRLRPLCRFRGLFLFRKPFGRSGTCDCVYFGVGIRRCHRREDRSAGPAQRSRSVGERVDVWRSLPWVLCIRRRQLNMHTNTSMN